MKKQMLSLLLTLCMALTLLPVSVLAAETPLTRGEARDLLIAACDDYNPAAAADTVLQGYVGGGTGEDRPVTRVQALVMLRRAFGDLPEPDSYWRTVSQTDVTYTDVPAWAAEDVAALSAAGMLTPSADGLLRPGETISRGELETYLQRMYTLYGSNLKDDFYASVDRTYLNEAKSYPGYLTRGIMVDLAVENEQRLAEIITEAVAGNAPAGTPEHTVKALYTTYVDMEGRQAAGLTPIQPWLDAIDGAETVAELDQVQQAVLKAAGNGLLSLFGLSVSADDSSQYMLTLWLNASAYGVDFYENGDPAAQAAYRDYLAKMMTLAGYSQAQAQTAAADYYAYERDLAAVELTAEEWYSPAATNNRFTLAELQAKLPTFDLSAMLELVGLQPEKDILVPDVGVLDVLAETLTQETLPLAKTVLRMEILRGFGELLSDDFYMARLKFLDTLYGGVEVPDMETRGVSIVGGYLDTILGELYVERYFSEEDKADVAEMIQEFLDAYAGRIDRLDWMSSATKAMAKRKLAAMSVNVGYPDQWPDTYDNVSAKTPQEGGTYFDNMCALKLADLANTAANQGQPVNPNDWALSVYEVNAFYDPSNNSINLLAGILQGDFYDPEASRAANLGSIGTVIGHEISHAFDRDGAQYDEKGNVANWWAEADLAAFNDRCQAVEDYYDGWEAQPGVAMNGQRTLGENIADLAGVGCALELLERDPQPDYKTFFTSYAAIWGSIYSPAYAQQVYATDVHAASSLRVNRVLSSLDAFYETYGIVETDGMYVAPADRVSIW